MKAIEQVAAEPVVLFRTASLNLASYITASGRLNFHHAERHTKFSEFFFRDPDNCGPAIATEFATKVLKVPARLLLEKRSELLERVSKIDSASSQILTREADGVLNFCHEEAAEAVERRAVGAD